ncbi:hypothetical protein [Corynebacterium sp.]|uniref:hypothetical protein n=1 Tax=Corynebacterium sp. TaxID=1720 RepID=UPI0026DB9FB3|nr:hypothetical protein [Corynebacterium sp.]MDO4610008.1 hypothetical protein [Corynebacterium sp.]
MRFTKALAATLMIGGLVLTGCSDDDEQAAPPKPPAAPSSSSSPAQSSSSTPEETSAKRTATGPRVVDPADYTPPDGSNARLFVLADGVTECWMTDIGDAFLNCSTNFAEPPTVTDANGQQSVANSVSFNPSGITYETLTYPDTGYQPRTLAAGEQLSDFGYTCTALSDSLVECSGPQGTARIGDGHAEGARVPEPPATPSPAPEPDPAPAPGLPDVLGDLVPGAPAPGARAGQ